MTLRKYVIVYFIILSLTVVIAQKTASSTSSTISTTTTSGSTPSSTLTPPSSESCLQGSACKSANDTLGICHGAIKPPTKYIEEGTKNGTYRPEDRTLSNCMCNQPYYDTLSACIECFVNATETEFNVAPLEQYKDECKKLGTTFTQTIPPPQPEGIPRKFRLGLIAGVAAIIIGLVGIGLLKYFRRKRRIAEQSAFAKRYSTESHGSGNRLNTGDSLTAAYPPPSSPLIHYPPPPPPPTSSDTYQSYAPPTDYPPPSNISNIPTPQPTPYYPPPGGEYPPPRPPPPHGGQGGQSDSYYDGNF